MPLLSQLKRDVAAVAEKVGINVPPDWSGCDAVWPILERFRHEGAVVLIKLDGERHNRQYSIVVNWPGSEEVCRGDFQSLDDGLCRAILWGMNRLIDD